MLPEPEMDLTDRLSNLNLKTETHSSSSSSSSKNAKEKEVKRNWAELPAEVMSEIFLKLGYIDILGSAQWVCTSWWKLSKQPRFFHSIHMKKILTLFGRPLVDTWNVSCEMAREALERSSGQLLDFSVHDMSSEGLFCYISLNCRSLKRIRLVSCNNLSDYLLIQIATHVPQLEELEIIHCSRFSSDVIEAFGRFCPKLKLCRLNYVKYNSYGMFTGVPVAIAKNMRGLRHLSLFGSRLTDDDLKAILDGCPRLKSLDLRQCYRVKFAGALKKRCRKIEVMRFPFDPTDDFEYELLPYPFCDYVLCDSDDNEYDIYGGFNYDDYSDD